jgi:gluconate 5-dehydrogenase
MKREIPGLERFSLAGRVVLITGATRGLGLEIARGMAAAGAIVGINGRDPARAGEIAAAIPNAFAAPFDITDLPGAAVAIDAIVSRHGRLDCLVNNAAVRPAQSLDRGQRLSAACSKPIWWPSTSCLARPRAT